jgi:hypothetical protein
MASSQPGRITINTGTFTEDTCTVNYDLIKNQANKPAIRNMLEYANRRALTTLLVSGAVTPYGINNPERTKIPRAGLDGKGKGIGANAYRFDVMGRIEKSTEIIKQIGATQADGTFQLLMREKYLVPGMNAMFYTGRFTARVMGFPTGSQSQGYIYTFQSPSGDLFSWATHVAPQNGTKTCAGAYTSYSEKSLRGYGRSKFPDTFVNHMTIQRKTVAISGGAASNVLWYQYENEKGMTKGWMYQELAQANATFVMESERERWFGVSTMKNADGTLRQDSRIIDPETGLPVIQGDGVEEQLAGGNVAYGSGINGQWTEDDLADMMKALEKKSDMVSGLTWVGITGTDGYANGQKVLQNLAGNQNITFFTSVTQDGKPGGAVVDVGYNFGKFNVNGNTLFLVKHPMFDDEQFFPEKGADGQSILSSTLFLMNVGSGANMNMEVLCKEANGINREMVTAEYNGLTGGSGTSLSEEDAMKYAMLKEDLLCIYNTQECGIIYKS